MKIFESRHEVLMISSEAFDKVEKKLEAVKFSRANLYPQIMKIFSFSCFSTYEFETKDAMQLEHLESLFLFSVRDFDSNLPNYVLR